MTNAALPTANGLYTLPLFELLYRAHTIHREFHDPTHIQKCTLLSIKTGGCQEDCAYCPQSAHHKADTPRHALLSLEEVKTAAKNARENGAERFCMGAAWRNIKDGPEFDRVLEMIRSVKAEGLEACVTLGMLTESQAMRLKEAGLDAYNHNIDTSENFYSKIITTRTFDDRINTLKSVRKAGLGMCCGGIVGMGESIQDRCDMLSVLAAMDPPPESVPINLLIPVEGTPLANAEAIDSIDLVRTIAVARILMPESKVRLSAGRTRLSEEAQVLCFFAGANSIFLGDKLLTRPNPGVDEDMKLLEKISSVSV